jgi:POT family proton-dependent oligopeptide transporter
MGINLGAMVCNLFAAYMRNKYGWGDAFATAGWACSSAWASFSAAVGTEARRHADVRKPAQKEDMSLQRVFATVFLPAIIVGIGGWSYAGQRVRQR